MSTILIVEDHELTRKTLNRRLSKAGYSVLEAANGRSGLEMLRSNSVDLVLMDFMMKNMTGIQTYERMREMKPEIPCAMITAYAHSGLTRQFIDEGGADFIVKPIGEDFDLSINSGTGDAVLDMDGQPIKGYFEFTVNARRGKIDSPIEFDNEEEYDEGDEDYVRKYFTKGGKTPRYFISTGTGTAELEN